MTQPPGNTAESEVTGDSHPRTGAGYPCSGWNCMDYGSGRHSSDPQHRRCGVGYYTVSQCAELSSMLSSVP
eukprot:3383356-Amphidinium_carterae.1